MANNMSSRQACHAARYVVARVLRGLFWCLKYTVILPLATMALMALFVLWKDNTTPGKLLVKEINFVRQTAPAGQFPVSECWFSSSDSSGRSEIQDICHYRAADAADYVRETDRSLMQLVTALWATLALMYVSLAAITGKYPVRPGKMKCIRVVTADEHLKEVYTEDASLPGKIGNALFIFLMTEQTETTEIKMNMRNINAITALSVPGKTMSDDFMHAVLSNCTTRIVLPAPKEFSSESLPHNFNMAAVGVMKEGMSMRLFSSPGHIVVAGQSGGGKSASVKELIDRIIQKYKEPFDE